MTKRSSAPARALAATAVVCGFVVLLVVIATSLSVGGDGNGDGRHQGGKSTRTQGSASRGIPASYVVQNGDTLTSIAHRMGVPVKRIQTLNPGVDPQILISGEKLKLR
jgi:LysM repeat protein